MMNDTMPIRPWIVVVGGFLGAGKTTLILAAARELERVGKRCAVILNDQGSALVDTRLTDIQGMQSGEVTGGCFCCNLSDLLDVAGSLRLYAPHVIFAEPAGSCADIVATVVRPLQNVQHDYRVAPFTVLLDPRRMESIVEGNVDASMNFLFRKQIEEADLICFTKSDLHPHCTQIPGYPVRQVSAVTGQGVLAWLDEVLSGSLVSGGQFLDIDYEQYARAEAALAWLNFEGTFQPEVPLSPAMLLGPLLDAADRELTVAGVAIVHLKAVMTSEAGYVKAALCSNGEEPRLEGNLDASPASRHELLLNLRAIGAPERVREVMEEVLVHFRGKLTKVTLDCFTPAAPVPEQRIVELRHDQFRAS